jgi:hypothetical protein
MNHVDLRPESLFDCASHVDRCSIHQTRNTSGLRRNIPADTH